MDLTVRVCASGEFAGWMDEMLLCEGGGSWYLDVYDVGCRGVEGKRRVSVLATGCFC